MHKVQNLRAEHFLSYSSFAYLRIVPYIECSDQEMDELNTINVYSTTGSLGQNA